MTEQTKETKGSATAGNGGDPSGFEPDKIEVGKILMAVIGVGILVTILSVIAVQLVQSKSRNLVYEKELSLVDPRLAATSAGDEKELNTYKVMDASKGWYQIPISLALKEMAAHPEMIAPIKPPPEAGSGQ